jgi:hypothetical protein
MNNDTIYLLTVETNTEILNSKEFNEIDFNGFMTENSGDGNVRYCAKNKHTDNKESLRKLGEDIKIVCPNSIIFITNLNTGEEEIIKGEVAV